MPYCLVLRKRRWAQIASLEGMGSLGGPSARIFESTLKVTYQEQTYDRSYREGTRLGETRSHPPSELDSIRGSQIGASITSPPPYVEQGSAVAQAWREISSSRIQEVSVRDRPALRAH